MKTVFEEVKSLDAVRPVATDSAATAIVIDTLGFDSAMFVVQNGAATGTPSAQSIVAKVQECDTSNGDFADVSGASVTITASNKSAEIPVEGLTTGRKRYLKLLVTPTLTGGTTPAALLSAICLLGRALKTPVGNSSTPA
ncbi:MAG: hypothetical protein MNSN_01590 [Minisyncoccus archaeiphilus]|uniref:hypothetical protein n=1 Tax=Minisyncoccus archaeiphilus TaxID=3238481 RepID=UPI002B1303DB|nr:MAG: hypothetical protein MNSN_01590 [Candidatus Parcubacteria bacterium]